MSLNVLRDIFVFSCSVVPVRVFVTLWMVDCQAPLSMKFSRQESWSSLPFPPPGDLPDRGIEAPSPVSLAFRQTLYLLSRQVFPNSLRICLSKNVLKRLD